MNNSLEDRFFKFLKQIPSSENIDDFEIPTGMEGKQKSDFFIDNRTVIIEIKTLKTNPEHKVEKELEKHREREKFPLIYGQVDIYKILAYLPDGAEINAKIFEKTTRALEQGFRSANSQIRDTKTIFKIKNAIGLLVLLNDEIDFYDPKLIVGRISQMLEKEKNCHLRYNHITQVWIVNETHFLQINKDLKVIPSIIVNAPNSDTYKDLDIIFDKLQKGWAKFNNLPLTYSDGKNLKDLPFKTFTELNDLNNPVQPRQKHWSREYKKKPYLRGLSDKELLSYGSKLFNEMTPYFLKGGSKPTKIHFEKFGSLFTHFIEEMSYRGLDWRGIHNENKET